MNIHESSLSSRMSAFAIGLSLFAPRVVFADPTGEGIVRSLVVMLAGSSQECVALRKDAKSSSGADVIVVGRVTDIEGKPVPECEVSIAEASISLGSVKIRDTGLLGRISKDGAFVLKTRSQKKMFSLSAFSRGYGSAMQLLGQGNFCVRIMLAQEN